MEKIKANHHTVVDWDFQTDLLHELSATTFISAPTSLRCWPEAGQPNIGAILCRIAETLCVPQGEVRTWYRNTYWMNMCFLIFRNQRALGGADFQNCYAWHINYSHAYLCIWIDGASDFIDHFPVTLPNNAWVHLRTVYWNGVNVAGEPALVVELYREIEGEWVQLGTTLYDTNNHFADSEINRSGIGAETVDSGIHFFDDTEIWGTV